MIGSAETHALAVEDQPQPQHAVRGRVLRADVEHHVGGVQPGAGADGYLTQTAGL